MFFNLPTLLTWARIVAIPLVVGVYYTGLDAPTQNTIARSDLSSDKARPA